MAVLEASLLSNKVNEQHVPAACIMRPQYTLTF